ncbi:MAG: AMP-binding protein [Caulobacterales bacterium]
MSRPRDQETQPSTSTAQHPRAVAKAFPDKTALIMADSGGSITYAEMVRRSDQAANLFASLGVAEGDTIAFLMENHLRYPEVCWAAKNSGLHYVCVSTHLNAADVAYILENSGAKLLVISAAMLKAMQAQGSTFDPATTMIVDAHISPFLDYEALLQLQPAAPLDRIRGGSMLYSSGTTGRPKAVRTPLADVPPDEPPLRQKFLVGAFGFSPEMILMNAGPFYHAAPLRKMMSTHRLGGTVVGFQKFDPQFMLDSIARYRATHGFFVPTMFIRMLRLPEVQRRAADVSTMRYAIHGAAPCPPSVKEAMIAWWGPVIYEIYGGTEGMGHTLISPTEWLSHKGSVGKPPAGCTLKIFDDAGNECPPNQPGLIYLGNGRPFSYHGDAEKTAAIFRPDGLATFGDVGYLDEDGYLYLTDRHAHMIISGGVNIYPQEAEHILLDHPAIADVAVIGVPDPDFGEQVKAVVELKKPADASAALGEDILAFCRDRLSPIKCPRSVDFIDALPRNDLGKLNKRAVRAPYWAEHATLIG